MNTTLSMTKRGLITLLTAGTLWAGLGLGSAFAEQDAKEYPATFCRPHTLANFGVGAVAVYNTSTTRSLTVFCPIVRDLMSRDAKLSSIKARYYNPLYKTRSVSCQLNQIRPTGKLAASSGSKKGRRWAPQGEIDLKFPKSGLSPKGDAIYVVTCKLPPSGGQRENEKVKLTGYSVWEKD